MLYGNAIPRLHIDVCLKLKYFKLLPLFSFVYYNCTLHCHLECLMTQMTQTGKCLYKDLYLTIWFNYFMVAWYCIRSCTICKKLNMTHETQFILA